LLEVLDLGKYHEVFAENEIDMAAAQFLTDDDLKELGLPMGQRRKFAAAIAALAPSASNALTAIESPVKKRL
jgi:hypothetical protein